MLGKLKRSLAAFWERAYTENITGLSGMVAYNLLLSVFPFALLVLFVFGQVLQISDVENSVLRDLQELFPETENDTLANALDRIQRNSAEIGLIAFVAGIWIGASFWGAMDTAFCRIYHVECRGWVEQKRFSLIMLLVVSLFLAASVVVPALEALIISGTDDLPLGLDSIAGIERLVLVAGGLTISFGLLCVIYWAVPKGHLPWRGVWPGALFTTIGAGAANALFPLYLVNISAIGEFGRIVSFVLVAMVWFYVLSLIILAGAVINALRYELHDTGQLNGWEMLAEETRQNADPDPDPGPKADPDSGGKPNGDGST